MVSLIELSLVSLNIPHYAHKKFAKRKPKEGSKKNKTTIKKRERTKREFETKKKEKSDGNGRMEEKRIKIL